MRIAVFQSAYPSGDPAKEMDPGYQPEHYTDMHTFEHHWINKATAKEEIDAVLAREYDAYFNFMWGMYEDDLAGIEAVQYLESKMPSFAGITSASLLQTKRDFYEAARKSGSPIVPGNDLSCFPLFVKPVASYASHGIDESSLCFTENELRNKVTALDRSLAPNRYRRPTPVEYTQRGDLLIASDILVTEYIRGTEHFVVVCQVGGTAIALCPERFRLPVFTCEKLDVFMTPELKYHAETDVDLLERVDNPAFYDAMQNAAVQAWKTANTGAYWGHIDIRVRPSGEIIVIEVNPMAGIFVRPDIIPVHDPPVKKHFPGGHHSLINCALAMQRLKSNKLTREIETTHDRISATYDKFAESYDTGAPSFTRTVDIIKEYISAWNFDGKVLDLGCGTGAFGRELCQHFPAHPKIMGIELSPQMAMRAKVSGGYETILEGSIQGHFSNLPGVDHIVSFYALQFLDEIDLDFVLTVSFVNAAKSITFSIDEIPDEYNEDLKMNGFGHMVQSNNIEAMDRFGVPYGWKLVHKGRHFAWKSKHVVHDVYTTVYRFERCDQ